MDSETAKRFDRLESKLDENHAAVMQRFHGERGDNGVYGRLQSVEYAIAVLRWGGRALWLVIITIIGGISSGWGHK